MNKKYLIGIYLWIKIPHRYIQLIGKFMGQIWQMSCNSSVAKHAKNRHLWRRISRLPEAQFSKFPQFLGCTQFLNIMILFFMPMKYFLFIGIYTYEVFFIHRYFLFIGIFGLYIRQLVSMRTSILSKPKI